MKSPQENSIQVEGLDLSVYEERGARTIHGDNIPEGAIEAARAAIADDRAYEGNLSSMPLYEGQLPEGAIAITSLGGGLIKYYPALSNLPYTHAARNGSSQKEAASPYDFKDPIEEAETAAKPNIDSLLSKVGLKNAVNLTEILQAAAASAGDITEESVTRLIAGAVKQGQCLLVGLGMAYRGTGYYLHALSPDENQAAAEEPASDFIRVTPVENGEEGFDPTDEVTARVGEYGIPTAVSVLGKWYRLSFDLGIDSFLGNHTPPSGYTEIPAFVPGPAYRAAADRKPDDISNTDPWKVLREFAESNSSAENPDKNP